VKGEVNSEEIKELTDEKLNKTVKKQPRRARIEMIQPRRS
jgi:hypothetical protein